MTETARADSEGGLLTLHDVADRLRRPEATLRQWRHRGYGPRSFRVGGKIVYHRADVERWIDEQMQSTAVGGTTA
jgi:hypothetical protein